MNQIELLSTARVKLHPGVRMGTALSREIVMLRVGTGPRLVLTPAQARVLTANFQNPVAVSEVLVALLAAERCPPLREFYETIVQAHAAGVLVGEADPAAAESACRWRLRLPAAPMAKAGGVLALVGLALIPLGPVALPVQPVDWVIGFAAACALMSLGQVIAACILTGSGCQVLAPRFEWRTLFPGFRIDVAEAVMGGPDCEAAVALARLAPLCFGCAAATLWLPGALFVLFATLLIEAWPRDGSPVKQFIYARYGTPPYSIEARSKLELFRRDYWADWQLLWGILHSRSGLLRLSWTLVWVALAVVFVLRVFPALAAALPQPDAVRAAAPSLRLAAFAFAAAVGALGIWLALARIRSWLLHRRLAGPLQPGDSPITLTADLTGPVTAELLQQFLLLRDLPDEDRAALAAAMEPIEVARDSLVFEEDQPGDCFYLVTTGRLAVQKQLPGRKARRKTIGWLGPGDSFGEIALLDATPRTATIQALLPSRLLRLSRANFDQLLLRRMGAARLREILQNTAFLGRLVHFSGWSVEELGAFAQRCSSVRYDAGVEVLHKGQPNQFFYLIYDGAFEVRQGEKVVRRLAPGDYFGEISLLENSTATAAVIATEESRCLTLFRTDFLKFFARDFRISFRLASHAEHLKGSRVL